MKNKLNIIAITEVYDFSIEGVFFHEFRKVSSWNNFTEYRDAEGRIIVAFDPPSNNMDAVLSQLLGKPVCPGEQVMISASPDILKEIESSRKEQD